MHVWDIATETWFAQSTTAEAGLYPTDYTSSYCSVVASAEDNSSHNIYLYIGGYETDGTRLFILTLPAFHWVLVYEPPEYDYRQATGAECLKIHEKHLVIYRGWSDNNICDYDKDSKRFQGISIYDISSLTWATKVGLRNQKYLVPVKLHAIIGGK